MVGKFGNRQLLINQEYVSPFDLVVLGKVDINFLTLPYKVSKKKTVQADISGCKIKISAQQHILWNSNSLMKYFDDTHYPGI